MVWDHLQEYSSNLGEVVDIVVSHQGLPVKTAMVLKLMDAMVVPAPESYRQHLQQFAQLGGLPTLQALPILTSFKCRKKTCFKACLDMYEMHEVFEDSKTSNCHACAWPGEYGQTQLSVVKFVRLTALSEPLSEPAPNVHRWIMC